MTEAATTPRGDLTEDTTTPRGRRVQTGLRRALAAGIVVALAALVALGVVAVRTFEPTGTPSAPAEGMEWVRSIHGFGSAADEQLDEPTAVAIAPNGDIYVNDPQRARVMRFRADGAFRSLVHTGAGGTGEGQFVRPAGLAVDRDGYLYVADPAANKVIVFDRDNEYVREWPARRPLGVEVGEDGVYVLTNGRVDVYSATGKLRGSFGARGRRPSDIDAYQGITYDGTRLYIADALNQSVKAFDRRGGLLWANPSAVSTNSPSARSPLGPVFGLPQDLVLDGAGRLVVIDAFAFEIVVLDADKGTILARHGGQGSQDGQFFYPTGIDYDPARDWFAIADTRNDRVQIVRIPGSGGGLPEAARRWAASPYLYCLPSALLAAAALVIGLLARDRRRRAGGL